MAGLEGADKLKEIVLFLGTAGAVMPVVKRLNISPTLGFLAAGIVLGPFVMGKLGEALPVLKALSFNSPQDMRVIGEFGVVFLFFMIGLELSLERVRVLRKLIFGFGASQFLATTAVIGAVAYGFGAKPVAALVIGAALAMSSTAVVVPALTERRQHASPAGRASFAVLLFQDLAVTPILVMIAMLASAGESGTQGAALWTLVQAAIGLIGLIFAGRLVLRPLFHSVAVAGSQEFFMAACLLVVIGAGFFAGLAGLSMAIGAFVGGLLLAETEFRRQIEATIEPFQGLLLGLFFVAIGARLDLKLLVETPVQILTMATLMIGIKAALIYLLAPGFKIAPRSRHTVAWLLAPGGEFAFVLLAAAADNGLVWPSLAGKLMVAVTLSMFLIPLFAMLLARLDARHAATQAPAFDTPDEEDVAARVIVIGGGRVGQMVVEMLARHEVPTLSVDTNPRNVAALRAEGYHAYYGDCSHPAFVEKLGLERARALVVTPGNPAIIDAIVEQARKINPQLTIVARARDRAHAQKLYELGVSDAVPETFEASLQLAESVLIDVGVPMGHVIASVHEKREKTRKRLKGAGGETRRRQAVRRLKAEQ